MNVNQKIIRMIKLTQTNTEHRVRMNVKETDKFRILRS